MRVFNKKLLTVFWVGHDQLTVVQGSSAKLDFSASALIDWTDEQKARETLVNLVPSAERRRIGELCLILPRAIFFTKLITLPSSDEQEIRKMVSLQINGLLPYAPEQAVWDFVVSGQRNASSDILILAVARQMLMKYLRILSSVGFFPTVVTVSSYALAELWANVDPAGHKVLFFSDENSTEICFCYEGKFYFSRSIAYGTKDFAAGKFADFWISLRLTFEAQRKSFSQYGAPAGLYLKRSLDDFDKAFVDQLIKVSGFAWEDLSVESSKRKTGAFYLSQQKSLSADTVLSLAFLEKGFKNVCNFLPKDFKDQHSLKAGRQSVIFFICLFLTSVFSVTLALGAPIVKKLQHIKSLDEQLRRTENPFLKLRKEQEILASLKNDLAQRVSLLDLVQELYAVVPSGVAFTRIRLSEQNKLDLEGQAFISSSVNDLQEKMTGSFLFSDVNIEHTVRRSGPLGEVVRFEITSKIKSKFQNDKGQ